jgi:uncharacterized protein
MSAARDSSSEAIRTGRASRVRVIAAWITALPGALLISIVRVYQWTLSPLIGRQCRFAPTCSEYFIQAVRKYGAVVGSWRGVRRILRCHPFHPGGYDPP